MYRQLGNFQIVGSTGDIKSLPGNSSRSVKCPGFTFPADNKSVIPENLSWAPEADERERIDFVYYYPNKNLQIKSAQIVGPTGSIVRGQRIEEQTKDPIIPPVNNQWPSDHKGVLITFYIKE